MKKEAKIIAVINNKGGVGKTMTAQNLAAALAAKAKKVCMIDFDSQHNLTNRCENKNRVEELREQQYKGRTIEDYLSDSTLDIQPIEVKKNLYLIPSTIALAEYSASLYNMAQNENPSDKLKELCTYLEDAFDFIIVDSEPGMGALMVNATKAADLVIIPISCLDALSGADEGVFGIMDKNNLNTPYYFLQTMYENRLKSSREIRSQLLEEACENTFKTFIKRNEFLNNAGIYGLDVFEHAPKSGGANDYKDLATEVLSIFKKKNKNVA
jgi:par A-like chromosome partitioning protein